MAAQKSVPVVIKSTSVQRNFGELTRRVYSGREHFIVQREGLPVMAIISMSEYEEFLKDREQRNQEEEEATARQERLKRFEQAAREIGEEVEHLNLGEDQINDIVEAARQELYDKRRKNRSSGAT